MLKTADHKFELDWNKILGLGPGSLKLMVLICNINTPLPGMKVLTMERKLERNSKEDDHTVIPMRMEQHAMKFNYVKIAKPKPTTTILTRKS